MSEQRAPHLPGKWTRPHEPGRAIIRRRRLQQRVPFSMVHIWRLEKREPPEFPVRVQIGPRSVGWYEDEVDAWVNSRIRGSKKPKEPPVDPAPVAATAHLVRRAPFPAGNESAD